MRKIIALLFVMYLLLIAFTVWLASLPPHHLDVARLWPACMASIASLEGYFFGRLVEFYIQKTTGGDASGGDQ